MKSLIFQLLLSAAVSAGLFSCSNSSTSRESGDTNGSDDTGSDTNAGGDGDADGDGDVDADGDTDSDSDLDTDSDTDTDADADSDTDSDSDGDTDSETGSASDGDVDTDTDADTDTDGDTDSDTDTDTDSDSDTDVDGDTDADADADADGDSDTDTAVEQPTIPPTCEAAAWMLTSVGCSFFAVDLDMMDSSDNLTFAVVVSNPQENRDAAVHIEDMRGPGGGLRTLSGTDRVLKPGELHLFEVACRSGCALETGNVNESGIAQKSAFRVVSDVPVLAYQWNPYGTNVNTTDASLLIPLESLGTQYIGATWPNGFETTYLTVAATVDNTELTLTPTVDARVKGAAETIPAGTSVRFDLNAFDVLQIEPILPEGVWAPGDTEDLSGTMISASKKVAVFGGHVAASVPVIDVGSADHVEEQLLPLNAWGKDAVLARYAPRMGSTAATDPALWRIVAGADNMTVYFDPAVPGVGASHHFAAMGEVLSFESPSDHYAHGELDTPVAGKNEAPFLAYMMMTGNAYDDRGGVLTPWGDPFMLLAAPAGQYLDRYVFNTSAEFDFKFDHIIVVRPLGAVVEVDCLGVLDDAAFEAVGASGFEVARFDLDFDGVDVGNCEDGAHWLKADAPVGLSVVGEDSANSYGYLGGVGVRPINPIPVV